MQDQASPTQPESQYSICLFAPYFGTLPNYIPIFLKSCAWNPTIQWIIPSDGDWSSISIPPNVTIVPMTLAEVVQRAEKTVGCKIVMPRAYKLCDLKPMYGVIFQDLAQGYDFWGHCDLDVMLGDLRTFLTEEIFRTSVRVLEHGHLSMYRNDEQGRNLFRLQIPGIDYRDVMADPTIRVFDEMLGMNKLTAAHHIPMYENFGLCASINPEHQDLGIYGEPSSRRPRVFVWRKGKFFRESYQDGTFARQEFAYAHFMRRRMVAPALELVESWDHWLLISNAFVPTGEKPLSAEDMQEINKPSIEFALRWQWNRLIDYWQRRQYKSSIRKQYGYRSR